MKFIKRFNESNKKSLYKISTDNINDYIIDYIQLGFKTDISVKNSYLIISLKSNNTSTYKISDLEEAYDMLSSYLKDEFGLLIDYIYISLQDIDFNRLPDIGFNRFLYFDNFENIKKFSKNLLKTPNQIDTNNIIFGFKKTW